MVSCWEEREERGVMHVKRKKRDIDHGDVRTASLTGPHWIAIVNKCVHIPNFCGSLRDAVMQRNSQVKRI